jgi:2-polyprenyl-3-methyl-5-hydroxy-6-metoxy-1,4-benzoquinol methylase
VGVVNISCRICGSEAVPQLWKGSVCTSCSSISVTDLPSSEELERYYLKFNQEYHGGGRAKGAKARQLRYAYAYLEPILSLGGGKRLLDIGSSTNPFPNIASASGYDVTVLDYLKPADIDRKVRFVKGSIEDNKAIHEIGVVNFDIVTAFQVIEHCRNPRLMVEHMVRLCRDSGYIIIATPLVNSFSERNALGKTAWFFPPEHIHLITIDGMTKMFDALDCRLVSAYRYELNPLRWVLRYGLAYFEGCRGLLVKNLLPKKWAYARDHKTSKVQELIYYIFQKNN